MRNILLSVMLLAAIAANSQSWVKKFSSASSLSSMCFIDSTKGWAVGATSIGGTNIYKFQNNLWSIDTTSYSGYNHIFFVDSTHGWASDVQGGIIKYNGKTWSKDTSFSGFGYSSIYFKDINHGWAPEDAGVNKIACYSYGKWTLRTIPYYLFRIYALDTNHLWGSDSYRVFKCVDTTWSVAYTLTNTLDNSISDVFFRDSLNGWAAGKNAIFRCTNGVWSTVDLSLKITLNRLFFLNSNLGWFTSSTGYVVKYDNGNWTTMKAPVGATDIYFSSPTNGWLLAQWGGIYKFDTTKVITDITEENIFSEPEVFPNPASDYITISGTGNEETFIDIYNTNSMLVKTSRVISSEDQLFIGDLPAGIYVLRISDKNNTYSKKIIKQ